MVFILLYTVSRARVVFVAAHFISLKPTQSLTGAPFRLQLLSKRRAPHANTKSRERCFKNEPSNCKPLEPAGPPTDPQKPDHSSPLWF